MRPRYSKSLKQKILEAAEACDTNRMAMLLPKATKNDMNNAVVMAAYKMIGAKRLKTKNCLSMLIDAGADPDALYVEFDTGVTALFIVCRALIGFQYAKLRHRYRYSERCWELLHLELIRVVRQLIDAGANVNHVVNNGENLLEWTEVQSDDSPDYFNIRLTTLEYLISKGLKCMPFVEKLHRKYITNCLGESSARVAQFVERIYVRYVQSMTRKTYLRYLPVELANEIAEYTKFRLDWKILPIKKIVKVLQI